MYDDDFDMILDESFDVPYDDWDDNFYDEIWSEISDLIED